MDHFEFKEVPAAQWRRTPEQTALVVKHRGVFAASDVARPHLIPLTPIARNMVAAIRANLIPGINAPVGEVLVNGEWIPAFRFIRCPPEVGAMHVKRLNEAVEKFSRSIRRP